MFLWTWPRLVIYHFWDKTFLSSLLSAPWTISFANLPGRSSYSCVSTALFLSNLLNGFSPPLGSSLTCTCLPYSSGDPMHISGVFTLCSFSLLGTSLHKLSALVSLSSWLISLTQGVYQVLSRIPLYYKLILYPPPKICWNPSPQFLTMWPYFKK